jgi:hypothetical protein
MPASTIVSRVLAALNQADIAHMIVGSFARNYYADPRSTKDADLVLAVTSGSYLESFLGALGADFSLSEQMTFETNTGTFRSTLAHRESGFEIELFHLSNDPYDQERFRRRRATSYEGQSTHVLTAEDVIVTKLRWARGKDREDVRDVIALQGDAALDWKYIHHWTDQHGTREKLDAIRTSIPPLN